MLTLHPKPSNNLSCKVDICFALANATAVIAIDKHASPDI